MNNDGVIIKPIPNCDGYFATSDGRIWSEKEKRYKGKLRKTNRFLKPSTTTGYHCVKLTIDGQEKSFRVHRLIYLAFHGDIPKGLQVNHINEIKTDNRPENLNLMTPKENSNWGTRIQRIKEKLPQALKGLGVVGVSLVCIDDCGKYYFPSRVAASEFFDIPFGTFTSQICRMKKKGRNYITIQGKKYKVLYS